MLQGVLPIPVIGNQLHCRYRVMHDIHRSPRHGEVTRKKVFVAIANNPKYLVARIAEMVGISEAQVNRHIQRLRWDGRI